MDAGHIRDAWRCEPAARQMGPQCADSMAAGLHGCPVAPSRRRRTTPCAGLSACPWARVRPLARAPLLDERATRPDPPVEILQQHIERELADESRQQMVDEAEHANRAVESPLELGVPLQLHLVAEALRQKARRDQQAETVQGALYSSRQPHATDPARRDRPEVFAHRVVDAHLLQRLLPIPIKCGTVLRPHALRYLKC